MMAAPSLAVRAAGRLGLPGFVALALLAFAAWGEWVSAPEIEQGITALERRLAILGTRSDPPVDASVAARAVAAVYDRLPRAGDSNAALAALLELARAKGLMLNTVQYRAQQARLPRIWQHEVSLPVKGSYEALRSWLSAALQENPSLSLDSVELSRSDARIDVVEARVILSLWVGEDGPHWESVTPAAVASSGLVYRSARQDAKAGDKR